MSKKTFPFHTFLFALSPVFFLLSQNAQLVAPGQALLPSLGLLVFAGLLLAAGRILFGNWNKSALFVSIFVLIFFSHRDLFIFLERNGLVTRVRYLLAIYAVLFPVLFFLIRRIKSDLNTATKVLNMMAAVLLFISGSTYILNARGSKPISVAEANVDGMKTDAAKPDIYYFVLDGYARADVMRDVLGYDNKPFLDSLRHLGFYIADSSRSNYSHTIASLASTLNYTYLDFNASESRRMQEMIKHSKAFGVLDKLGYDIYTFPTGFGWLDITAADHYIASNSLNDLTIHLINATPLTAFPLNNVFYVPMKRRATMLPYNSMEKLVQEPSPKMVYVHSICPHPPFIFGPNGEVIRFSNENWEDNLWHRGDNPKDGYNGQVTYINNVLLKTIRAIKNRSKTPPVIVMHSDHGSKFVYNHLGDEGNDFSEQFSNFCAVHLPGSDSSQIYSSVSPVNLFPILFNKYFDAGIALQPDRCIHYSFSKNPEYKEVTDSVRIGETQRRQRIIAATP